MNFGKIGEELFGDISEKFDNFCSEFDEAINCKLLAVGNHIKGFWSEIVQDKIPKSPENFVDVPNSSDSRMPAANIVDDEKNNIHLCPNPEVNIVVPDDHLQRDSSLEENAAMRMYENSNAGNKENCIDEAEISPLGSFESISGSCIKWETSRHVDSHTEAASDQQADSSVASSELSKAKLSDHRVESDDLLSMLSLGKSDGGGTEDSMDLEDYAEVNEISHVESSTAGAKDLLVTGEFMYTTQSQHAKPESYEDYFVVNSSEISSFSNLEKINGASKMKSVEAKENEHSKDQEQERSLAPTLPTADSVRRDNEFPEADWVVV